MTIEPRLYSAGGVRSMKKSLQVRQDVAILSVHGKHKVFFCGIDPAACQRRSGAPFLEDLQFSDSESSQNETFGTKQGGMGKVLSLCNASWLY